MFIYSFVFFPKKFECKVVYGGNLPNFHIVKILKMEMMMEWRRRGEIGRGMMLPC